MMLKKFWFCLSLLALPCTTSASEPWSHEIDAQVSVNKHSFHRVAVEGSGCQVNARLYFFAPSEEYADKRNVVRNHHRFRARLRLGDYKLESPLFSNDMPGERLLRFSVDTTSAGCWSSKLQKLWKVDVHGCRGQKCLVDPLD